MATTVVLKTATSSATIKRDLNAYKNRLKHQMHYFDKYYCGIYKLFVESKIKIYTACAISPNLVTQERI
jgi:hypothetical protein